MRGITDRALRAGGVLVEVGGARAQKKQSRQSGPKHKQPGPGYATVRLCGLALYHARQEPNTDSAGRLKISGCPADVTTSSDRYQQAAGYTDRSLVSHEVVFVRGFHVPAESLLAGRPEHKIQSTCNSARV